MRENDGRPVSNTRAYVLDATRAVHGDLGMVHPNDIVLALSHSGESEEIVRLLDPFKQLALALTQCAALLREARSVALGQRLDEGMRINSFGGGADLGTRGARPAVGDVVGDGPAEQEWFL